MWVFGWQVISAMSLRDLRPAFGAFFFGIFSVCGRRRMAIFRLRRDLGAGPARPPGPPAAPQAPGRLVGNNGGLRPPVPHTRPPPGSPGELTVLFQPLFQLRQ
jgi:hypothetical protein